MFVGEDGNNPISQQEIKESKDLLHRLIREQVINSRKDFNAAVFAMNRVSPYRGKDPEVDEILKLMERTFPTMPSYGNGLA